MDVKQSVQKQFAAVAPNYTRAAVHSSFPDLAAMVAAAPSGIEDMRVLDVGCGAGHTALAFAEIAREVVALDLTPAMLDEVRSSASARGLENLKCREGDAEALPYPAGSFDLVTCRLCAHHFPHVGRAVGEMARVLRSGGSLLLSDSISPDVDLVDTYLNAIEVARDPSHVRNHRLGSWCSMLEAAGLVEARVLDSWPCLLEFTDWTERMQTPADGIRGLHHLFDRAPTEVREALAIDAGDTRSFTLTIALLRARKSLD